MPWAMGAIRPAGDRRGAPGSVLRLSCPPPSSDAPWGLGPPPSMCARDYVLAFLVLGLKKRGNGGVV